MLHRRPIALGALSFLTTIAVILSYGLSCGLSAGTGPFA